MKVKKLISCLFIGQQIDLSLTLNKFEKLQMNLKNYKYGNARIISTSQ